MAVQEWKKVCTNRDRRQCKHARAYEPTEIDGSARMEESINHQRDSQFQKGRKYEPTEIDGSARKEESMNRQR